MKKKKNRKKKLIFLGDFFSFRGQRSVTAAWATPSPWSIIAQVTEQLTAQTITQVTEQFTPQTNTQVTKQLTAQTITQVTEQLPAQIGPGGFACATRGGVAMRS